MLAIFIALPNSSQQPLEYDFNFRIALHGRDARLL